MLKRFIQYYKPQRKLFILDMICAFTLSICDLVFPTLTRQILNHHIPEGNLRMVLILAGVLLGAYVFKLFLNYFILYYGHLVGVHMQAQMRRDVFTHLQALPFKFFDNNKTGSLMSRIVADLFDISELAHHGPEDVFISLVLLLGSFIMMSAINVWLTLIIFAFLPFLVYFSAKKRLALSRTFMKTREEIAEVNAILENSLSGIRVSKAFVNHDYEQQRFNRGNEAFVKARSKAYKVMAEFHAGNTLILDCLNVVVIVAGGVFAYCGKITVGDFVTFLLYVNIFLGPINRLISFIEQYQNAMSGFQRVLEILDTPLEQDKPDAVELSEVQGRITFENVSFSYEDDSPKVLNNISLDVMPGRKVALVGPSGGGKTTLCHLIPRFYPLKEGRILLDGRDITDFTLSSLRRHIGIVQQDVFLFTGTIYENILYGNVNATREEVIEAAKKAQLHDFIMSLENGYETYIGERGVKLSGGQKQRIAIARVFLKNPPILILDEATSALDNVTELQIQQSLDQLCAGRTSFVVAHRLSTVRNADEIIVLSEEGIEERGTHEELMAKNGVYAHLYQTQFSRL